MSFNQIPAGKDLPNDVYVAIEIPANHAPIKYEIDKEMDALVVDRFGGLVGLLIFSGTQTAALALYAMVDGLAVLYLVSALFGVGYGGISMCYPVIVREQLPAVESGHRLGIVLLFGALGMALGARLRSYRFDKYRTKEKSDKKPSLRTLTIRCQGAGRARAAVTLPSTTSAPTVRPSSVKKSALTAASTAGPTRSTMLVTSSRPSPPVSRGSACKTSSTTSQRWSSADSTRCTAHGPKGDHRYRYRTPGAIRSVRTVSGWTISKTAAGSRVSSLGGVSGGTQAGTSAANVSRATTNPAGRGR